jgi:hypothetical protein
MKSQFMRSEAVSRLTISRLLNSSSSSSKQLNPFNDKTNYHTISNTYYNSFRPLVNPIIYTSFQSSFILFHLQIASIQCRLPFHTDNSPICLINNEKSFDTVRKCFHDLFHSLFDSLSCFLERFNYFTP